MTGTTTCSCGCGTVIFEGDSQVVATLTDRRIMKCGELSSIELFVAGHDPAASRHRCEVCGVNIRNDRGRCTNGRCSGCHARLCTGGGNDSPGHGRGPR